MVGQVLWLFVSYALVGALAGVLLELEAAPAAAGVMIVLPALRIWRRFSPGKGYYLPSFDEPGSLQDRSIRATLQEYRSLFMVMVGIELAIVTFIAFTLLNKSGLL